MRITITQDFETPEAAATFLARIGNPAYVVETLTAAPVPEKVDAKKERKARSDAGHKREPYGSRTPEANPGAAGAQGENPGGAPAGSPAATPGAASTATAGSTTSPAPASTGASSAASSSSVPATPKQNTDVAAATGAPATEEFPASLEGARKAMKALDGTANKGMDACIASLRAYGVNRITDLPTEKYGEFIKGILVQCSPEGLKIAREWAARAAPKK